MTYARRVAVELAKLFARWFLVLLIAFGLLSCLRPGVRGDGSGRLRDRIAEQRALERWSLDLPALVNTVPADAIVRCRRAWKTVSVAYQRALDAGLSESDVMKALTSQATIMPRETPRDNAEAGRALFDLQQAQSDFVLLQRHGSLARFSLEADGGSDSNSRDRNPSLRQKLQEVWSGRGSARVNMAPPEIEIEASARAILSALIAGREPSPDAATFAPWALGAIVRGLSEVPDAHYDSAITWLVSRTALPDPRIQGGATRAEIERELNSIWRRQKFALSPSSTGSRIVATLTETRFATWCSGVLRGDFGSSIAVDPSSRAMTLVMSRLPTTLLTCGLALLVASTLGVFIGLRRSGKPFKDAWWAMCWSCLPEAWIGTLVLLVLSQLSPESSGSSVARWAGAVLTLAIPATAIFVRQSEAVARVVRRAPWIEAARARGTPEALMTRRHVWPHARPSVLALVALSLPALVTGSVVVESLFRLEGVGALLADAAVQGDFPVGLAAISVSAVVLLLARALMGVVEPETRGHPA